MDESKFTYKTLQKTAYTRKKENLILSDKEISCRSINLIAGVSVEYGLEAVYLTTANINSEHFIKIIPMILQQGD